MFHFKHLALAFIASTLLLTSCSSNVHLVPKREADTVQDEFANDAEPERVHYEFTNRKGETEKDDFFYSDDFFKHRATRYNPHLATLSMRMTKFSMNPGGPNDISDTDWYQRQPDRLDKFFETIHFTNSDYNDDYRSRTGFDTIGIGAASRVVTEGSNKFTVIACTVRSGGYFLEWGNNVFLGTGENSDMMHEGWYNAANKVIDFVGNYIKKFNIQNQIKLWISGYSRGGATMNIAGGLLDNKIGMDDMESRYHVFDKYGVDPSVNLKREDLIVYTFEAPQGASYHSTSVAAPKSALYNNIFNIVNPNDLVTKVAMGWFEFTRFGIDKFITTQFFDPANFENNRRTVKAFQKIFMPDAEWVCDNFYMKGLSIAHLLTNITSLINGVGLIISWIFDGDPLPDLIVDDATKVHYDANITLNTVIDFACAQIGSRDYYCNALQDFAITFMNCTMTDDSSGYVMSWQELLVLVAFQAIGYVMFGDVASLLPEAFVTHISGQAIEQVLAIAGTVFLEYPNDVISICTNISDVFENHNTHINVAHAQSQDSYFIDYYNTHDKPAEDADIDLVPYRDDASYFRYECIDVNQGEIRVSGTSHNVIDVLGHSQGASDINNVDDGYAFGYYNYATYERTEWFLPLGTQYATGFYENSWDAAHEVKITGWKYASNDPEIYRFGKVLIDQIVNCDGGPYTGGLKADGTVDLHE